MMPLHDLIQCAHQLIGRGEGPLKAIDVSDAELQEMLAALRGTDVEQWNTAYQRLQQWLVRARISKEQAVQLLREAADPFVARVPAEGSRTFPWETEPVDPSNKLVELVACRDPFPELIGPILDCFERYKRPAQRSAQVILTRLGTAGATAQMDLLRRYARCGTMQCFEPARHADADCLQVYYPELVDYLDVPPVRAGILRMTLDAVTEWGLPAAVIEGRVSAIAAAFDQIHANVVALGGASGQLDLSDDRTREVHYEAGLLLHLMGSFCRHPDIDARLRQASELRDSVLAFHAAGSLIENGASVSPAVLEHIASAPQGRDQLYRLLKRQGLLALFPERFRRQASLAEADMVRWLMSPSELGRAPDEIELIGTVPVTTSDGAATYTYFVFRYRARERLTRQMGEWLVGVSGPFLDGSPSIDGLGDTFSSAEEWDDRPVEQWVDDLQELLERCEAHHAQELSDSSADGV